MRAAKVWPTAIVGVLAIHVIATGLMMRAAGGDEGNAVEPDYYRRAVAWDSTAAARARAAGLGWSVVAEIGPIGDDGRAQVTVGIRDAQGAPVTGAEVRVEAIHNAHARHHAGGALTESAAGDYAAPLALRWAGRWELRIGIVHDGITVPVSLRREAFRS